VTFKLSNSGVVAVVTMDRLESIRVSNIIRRAGIPRETYFTGNIKKQMKKSSDLEAVILVQDGAIFIKDMLTGIQREVTGDLVKSVEYVLYYGYHEDDVCVRDNAYDFGDFSLYGIV